MMNTMMLALGLGMSLSAYAVTVGPAVGDQAKYTLTSKDTANGPITTFNSTSQILSINAAAETANVQQTMVQNGLTLSQAAYDQAFTDLAYPTASDIQGCAQLGNDDVVATVESIHVKAGTFQSCHLKTVAPDAAGNINDTYLGAVPFGILKTVDANPATGANQTMELQTYKKF